MVLEFEKNLIVFEFELILESLVELNILFLEIMIN